MSAENTRKVLFLSYYFPPLRTSGTFRSESFAKLLGKLGWEPTVLSVASAKDRWVKLDAELPEGISIKRSLEWNLSGVCDFFNGLLSKLYSLSGKDLKTNYFRELFCLPDSQIAWFSTVQGISLAKSADVIYVSCSPFSSAFSGCLIKFFCRKPLVIDFRDAWTLNPHVSHVWFHKKVIAVLERIVVSYADSLILNTAGALKLYQKAYPAFSEKMQAIPNGYDVVPEFEKVSPPEKTTFYITHVGSFYGERSPRLLLEALAELKDPNIEFVQIGSFSDYFFEFETRVKITHFGSLPHAKALELMQGADLLYLKQGFEVGVEDYVAVGAKTYEYLATGLPILADCPAGDNAAVVANYAAYPYVVTTNKVEDLKRAIVEAKQRAEAKQPKVTEGFREKFSREKLAGELAGVFERVCDLSNTSQASLKT